MVMRSPPPLCTIVVLIAFACFAESLEPAQCAQAVTGIVAGRVVSAANGAPIAVAEVAAASASGRYRTYTDQRGRYALVGVSPDTYAVTIAARGYESRTLGGITILPGATVTVDAQLVTALREIGRVTARGAQTGVSIGETENVFRVVGERARGLPAASGSGLGPYTANSVQGAVAAVPGVEQDQFANVILQGGKVQDTVFSYNGVPVPQALIAEPGGNIVGAQLPTTGLGYTTVETGGLSTSSNQALAGIINEIPATGIYPGVTTVALSQGITPALHRGEIQSRWASPNLRQRYALDAALGSQHFSYGDGTSFYPSEAGTYGVALADNAQFSVAANVHVKSGEKDDLSFVALIGQETFDQYGTPFSGLTYGLLATAQTPFPGGAPPDTPVTSPTRIRGQYSILQLADLRTFAHSSIRLSAYRSAYNSLSVGPYWDDLSFPNGPISYYGTQHGELYGLGFDVQDVASERHTLSYGAEGRSQTAFVDELVPTQNDRLVSAPILNSFLTYVSDRWTPSARLSVTATARLNGTHVLRSDGNSYGQTSLDPHLGLNYRLPKDFGILLTYDHITAAPQPLETQLADRNTPVPFVEVAPEVGQEFEAGFEHGGKARGRIAYFAKAERNLIDVLPVNFHAIVAGGNNPSPIGVPTNAGDLLAHGFDLSLESGPVALSATYVRGFSSSASQFAYNSLNVGAIAAGHLFPLGYVPDFVASLRYRAVLGKRVSVVPVLSYQSGYPFGNGRATWSFDAHHRPVLVANDNHINPGYNYWFLRDPSKPYEPNSNPYIGSLGTPEGTDPNTLRTAPQLLASLHVDVALSPKLRFYADAFNLFAVATPTQLQSNPYLIGPPGYRGGNAAYARWYGQQLGADPYPLYVLGNGVPTLDGTHQTLPWRYGTAGYVPASYPNARSVFLGLERQI
ncbi:MAG: TonB-dependent receptor [Candidatus Eremiobacteraeota bacterium]|nr:TonB-dependent receptor [Candidatus Eremiobacteraeota bacterium]